MDKLKSKWQINASETIHDCRIFKVCRDHVTFQGKNEPRDFYTLDCQDWCNVVAVLPDGRFLLVKQYRHGIRDVTIEFPAGLIDPGDVDPPAAGLRELREETGYQASNVQTIGKVRTNPAFINNWSYVVLATDLQKLSEPQLDPYEDIELIIATENDINKMIQTGEMNHTLSLSAWKFYSLYLASQK